MPPQLRVSRKISNGRQSWESDSDRRPRSTRRPQTLSSYKLASHLVIFELARVLVRLDHVECGYYGGPSYDSRRGHRVYFPHRYRLAKASVGPMSTIWRDHFSDTEFGKSLTFSSKHEPIRTRTRERRLVATIERRPATSSLSPRA